MRLLISLHPFRRSIISSSMTLVNGLVLIPEDKIGVAGGDKVGKVGNEARLEYCTKIKSW